MILLILFVLAVIIFFRKKIITILLVVIGLLFIGVVKISSPMIKLFSKAKVSKKNSVLLLVPVEWEALNSLSTIVIVVLLSLVLVIMVVGGNSKDRGNDRLNDLAPILLLSFGSAYIWIIMILIVILLIIAIVLSFTGG